MEEISRILDIPYKKTAKAMVPYLTGDEMRILLSQPDGSTREGFRDLVLLSVLYDTAARVQELADLEIKDVRIEKPSVITLHGKEIRPDRYLSWIRPKTSSSIILTDIWEIHT